MIGRFGDFEFLQLSGPLSGEEFPGDFCAALGLQGVCKQLADGRTFFRNTGDLTNLAEFVFGEIDGDFHLFEG